MVYAAEEDPVSTKEEDGERDRDRENVDLQSKWQTANKMMAGSGIKPYLSIIP